MLGDRQEVDMLSSPFRCQPDGYQDCQNPESALGSLSNYKQAWVKEWRR